MVSKKPAPVVNPYLAQLFANEPDPIEKLCANQNIPTAIWKAGTADLIKGGQRLAVLMCRHYTLTKSSVRAKCQRCGEMIRAGYDYDAFRNLGETDDFSWPDDPLRPLHEEL